MTDNDSQTTTLEERLEEINRKLDAFETRLESIHPLERATVDSPESLDPLFEGPSPAAVPDLEYVGEHIDSVTGGPPEDRSASGTESMKVDFIDEEEEFILEVDIPGYERDEISVYFGDETLHIQASRSEGNQDSKRHYLKRERPTAMERAVPIPDLVDNEDEISASYEKGVLTVRVPKMTRSAAESRDEIDIK